MAIAISLHLLLKAEARLQLASLVLVERVGYKLVHNSVLGIYKSATSHGIGLSLIACYDFVKFLRDCKCDKILENECSA